MSRNLHSQVGQWLQWCFTMVSYNGVLQWCLTMVSYNGVLQWCLTMVSYNGVLQWCLTMVSYSGVLQWCLIMVSYSGVLQWWLTMVSYNGGLALLGWARTIYLYGVHILAGKSPYIRSSTVCIYGSGQPLSKMPGGIHVTQTCVVQNGWEPHCFLLPVKQSVV